MFKPIQFDSGRLVKMAVATGQTVVKGDALADNGSGYLATVAADGGTPITHVAMETVTTTADGQMVLCIRTEGVVFEADCEQAVSVTDIGTYVDMASKSTLDPDSVTDQIFYIESIVGGVAAAETSTKVVGWFAHYAPNAN
jgi:Na+-translocating ferredoxin:NAD+ oxidoreductase RnfC subunit